MSEKKPKVVREIKNMVHQYGMKLILEALIETINKDNKKDLEFYETVLAKDLEAVLDRYESRKK